MPTLISRELYIKNDFDNCLASIHFAIYSNYLHVYYEEYFDDMNKIIFKNIKIIDNTDNVIKYIIDAIIDKYCPFLKYFKDTTEIDESDDQYFIDFKNCQTYNGIIQNNKFIII
jgi:hypothetical protein